jgi:DNA invertase Pin-like site-specific DNA recombinase
VFAELERAMIRERTMAAMNVKRGRNERMSHKIPFGWDEGDAGILLWNEKEQRAIVWMKQWQRDGKSLRKIAAMLNDRGVEPKRAKRWLHSSVLRILARTA